MADVDKDALAQLAPTGVLRAAINMGNPLLVTSTAANGDPAGVAPDMARVIADRLGVSVRYIPYPSPGALADALASGAWDIGLIAIEPERAAVIHFTAPYVEIEATYLAPAGSALTRVEEVDIPGRRIAVSGRSAYDLYLSRTLKSAELVRGPGLPGAFDLFVREKLDVLAGLRPALLEDAAKLPGSRVLEGRFTTVQQAVGMRHGAEAGAAFLRTVIEDAKRNGFVAELLDKHGVSGRLSVAPAA